MSDKYRMIALSVTGKGGRVIKNTVKDENGKRIPNIIDESEFEPGTIDQIMKAGFIAKIGDEEGSGDKNDESDLQKLLDQLLLLNGGKAIPKTWGEKKVSEQIAALTKQAEEAKALEEKEAADKLEADKNAKAGSGEAENKE